jgi:predicted ATPase
VRLANLHERDEEGFAELNAVLRRLSLAEQITFHKYSLSGPGEAEDFGIVAFDGVNIGHLSDGTLRVTEMLVHLLRRHLTVLCVEEPETAVHPGLLQGVLAELESYGLDRQVVVSTHSPNVVNWFAPREVRLVERTGGDTEVRRISDLEMPQVEAYLNNEGLLDGYLFNREE